MKLTQLVLSPLLALVTIPMLAQVAPSARKHSLPLVVGGGVSDFALDWAPGQRMEGITGWADWNFTRLPGMLNGLGLQAEVRDVNWNMPKGLVRHRMDTAGGGVIYTWRHFNRIQPYAKWELLFGSIDFHLPQPYSYYSHETRTVDAPGGGLEFRLTRHIWARGDYEYQFWPQMFGPHALNPNGFTVGASYHFSNF